VASDVTGVSARQMLAALVAGTTDPGTLAELAKGRLRTKREALARALSGRLREHHRSLISMHLEHIDFLDEQIAQLSERIADQLRPFESILLRLQTIPGVGRRIAEIIAAEIGCDMSHFPTAGHLASWAGICPGNHETAGKRRSGKTRRGSKWLQRALYEAAQAAGRSKKGGFLARQYHRIRARAGRKVAAGAVAHTILITSYYLLTRHEVYHDEVPAQFQQRHHDHLRDRAIKQLQALGYEVSAVPKTSAA